MAKFISGRLNIDVKFNDRTDKYQVRICPTPVTRSINRSEFPCQTQVVGLPGAGVRSRHGKRIAVDDPRAMMSAARAGISFSSSEIQDFADWKGSHAVVRPPRGKRRK